nr:hypothetical protein [Thermomonospora umbrina]
MTSAAGRSGGRSSAARAIKPRRLLRRNSELRRIGVWQWTLPALAARLPDARTLAVLGPSPVGIPANRIPKFRRRQGPRSFRQWQTACRPRCPCGEDPPPQG